MGRWFTLIAVVLMVGVVGAAAPLEDPETSGIELDENGTGTAGYTTEIDVYHRGEYTTELDSAPTPQWNMSQFFDNSNGVEQGTFLAHEGELIFVNSDGFEDPQIVSLDMITGEVNWMINDTDSGLETESDTNPLIINDTLILSVDNPNDGVVGIDVNTGEQLWRYGDSPDTSNYINWDGGVAFQNESDDKTVVLEPKTGEVRFKVNNTSGQYDNLWTIQNESHIFTGRNNYGIVAVDKNTREVDYTANLTPKMDNFISGNTPPARLVDGHIFNTDNFGFVDLQSGEVFNMSDLSAPADFNKTRLARVQTNYPTTNGDEIIVSGRYDVDGNMSTFSDRKAMILEVDPSDREITRTTLLGEVGFGLRVQEGLRWTENDTAYILTENRSYVDSYGIMRVDLTGDNVTNYNLIEMNQSDFSTDIDGANIRETTPVLVTDHSMYFGDSYFTRFQLPGADVSTEDVTVQYNLSENVFEVQPNVQSANTEYTVTVEGEDGSKITRTGQDLGEIEVNELNGTKTLTIDGTAGAETKMEFSGMSVTRVASGGEGGSFPSNIFGIPTVVLMGIGALGALSLGGGIGYYLRDQNKQFI